MTKPHYRRTSDGGTVRVSDGLQNVVSGMGTARDKAASAIYVMNFMADDQIEAAYRTSAMAQRIIDIPAEDAGREWREWKAKKEQISAIEAEEKRLGLQRKLIDAIRAARCWGGGAIFIGDGASELSEELVPDKIGKGGIKYLTMLRRQELNAGEIERDPREASYGRPKEYTINTPNGAVRIHPSRLVILPGKIAPGGNIIQSNNWGDSVLNTVLSVVQRDEASSANVESLMYEAKVDVLKVKNLTDNLRNQGAKYEELLLRRFQLANMGKGINGALLLDADEDYQQKSASFGGIPDIMDKFAIRVSAASSIPMTRLFGTSPGGLNSTGESDLRGYYDLVRVHQTLWIEPEMQILDECLIRSALGSRPDELHYSWRPLWQLSEKEITENADKLMSAAEKADRIGITSTEALGKAAVNALTESGAFPGLESYDGEFGGDDPDTEEESSALENRSETGIDDAAPRTLYVSRRVENAAELIAWAKEQGFKSTLPADDLHVTIAFSRKTVDWMKAGQPWGEQIEVPAGGPRLMEQFGEARVFLFASSHLSWRHEEIKRAGATWDHPEYQPHITISYDEDAPDLSEVEPYKGRIVLGPELFSEIKENWKEGISEE